MPSRHLCHGMPLPPHSSDSLVAFRRVVHAGSPILYPRLTPLQLPVITRSYVTLSVLTTAGCALEVHATAMPWKLAVQIITPFSVYFNTKLIFQQLQIWRLLTNFLYFGSLGAPPCLPIRHPCRTGFHFPYVFSAEIQQSLGRRSLLDAPLLVVP